jgi:hypothetical protein
MARFSGKSVLVSRESTPVQVVLQTECSLSLSRDPVEVTSKDDDYAVFVAGTGNWTVSFGVSYDASAVTHDGLWDDLDGSTEQDLAVAVDTENYAGKAFCTSLSFEGGGTDGASVSAEYQGSGDVTKS